MESTLIRRAFDEAADLFLRTAGTIDPARLDEPGLGVWTIRDLLGHTSRSFVTIEEYLAAGAAEITVSDAGAYYRAVRTFAVDPDAIAQRGRDAGAALGAEPVAALHSLTRRVVPLVHDTPDDAITGSILGGARFIDYLQTRIVELGVHTLDLGAALGQEVALSEAVAGVVLHTLADAANTPERAQPVILALTGRAPLPEGFCVV